MKRALELARRKLPFQRAAAVQDGGGNGVEEVSHPALKQQLPEGAPATDGHHEEGL